MTQFYVNQLKRLKPDRKLELHDSWAKICCPIHNQGKERTPSLKINLVRNGSYQAGRWICFGCGKFGTWDKIAKPLHLTKDDGRKKEFDLFISDDIKSKLFSNVDDEADFIQSAKQMDKAIELAQPWPPEQIWRTISGKIVNKVGGRLIATDYGARLYLPAFIDKKFQGGITCTFNKAKLAYIYDSGGWIKQTVFPFDYASKLLKRANRRVLFYVEGPRDALAAAQYNIPTVANLGGTTVWSEAKAELILSLQPELLVIATDPDEIGNQLASLIKKDLKGQVKMIRLKYPKQWYKHLKPGDKPDPGNSTRERWLDLKKKLEI